MKAFRRLLECFSFLLWIAFTMFALALAGLGIEGLLLAAFMFVASSQPIHFPIGMAAAGIAGVILSIVWRQIGVDYLHYLQYDGESLVESDEETPSEILQKLIDEVEASAGNARTEARAKAKSWLVDHVSSLEEEDKVRARDNFGYLLPAGWGSLPVSVR